ncbi:MAG TPA: S8 family serine peptidase [Phototrophicaceae bacterium]|nr:S8 family serine peptidase [Phototrophicaceae bacterium]
MKRLCLILMLLIAAIPLTIYAQGGGNGNGNNQPHVYILVVDDFGNNFGAITSRLRGNASVITRLRNEEQRLPRRGIGGSNNSGGNTGNGNTSSFNSSGRSRVTPQPTQTAIPSTLDQDLRQQARQAVMASVQGNIDQQNCTVIPEGQSFFATSGTSFFATSGTGFFATSGTNNGTPTAQSAPQPHGVRVSNEIRQLVQQYGSNLPIDVVPVDTNGYTTTVITNRLTQTIAQLSGRNPNASFVVNMSFAVVPCSALADLAVYEAMMEQTDADLAGDLTAMQAVFTQLLASGVYNSPLVGNDALQSTLTTACRGRRAACNSGNHPVIMVAAAGNSSEPFPFFPAAWNGIIAVSASDDSSDFVATTGVRSSYSNAGEVLMPGMWGTELGTSFAAPRYSFAMALFLLGQTPSACAAPIAPAPPVDWLNSPPNPPDLKLC